MNPVDIIIKMSKIEKGILKAAKKANSYTQGTFIRQDSQLILQQKLYRSEGMGAIYSNY